MKLMVAGDDYIAALGGIESSIRHTLQSSLENYNHWAHTMREVLNQIHNTLRQKANLCFN